MASHPNLKHEFDPETQEFYVHYRGFNDCWIANLFDHLLGEVFNDAWKALANRKEGETVEVFLDEYQHSGEYTESFYKHYQDQYHHDEHLLEWWGKYISIDEITSILTEASKGNYNISTVW